MNSIRWLIGILFLVSVAITSHAQTVSGVMMVVKGDIKVTGKDGKTEAAKVGKKVIAGDTIVSGPDSRAKIVMADKNVINISPDSKVVIEKYENDGKDRKNVELNVVYGKLRASVEQKYDGDKSKFNVKTPSAVAGVRGTDFITGYSPSTRSAQIITFQGSVAVGTPGPGGSIQNPVFVQAGQMTTAGAGKPPEAPKSVPKEELNKMNNESKADTASNGKQDSRQVASDGQDDKKEEKKDDKQDKKEAKEERKEEKKEAKEEKKDAKKEVKEEKKEAKEQRRDERKDAKNDKKERQPSSVSPSAGADAGPGPGPSDPSTTTGGTATTSPTLVTTSPDVLPPPPPPPTGSITCSTMHEGLIGVVDGSLEEIGYQKALDNPATAIKATSGWLGITDKYWAAAVVPAQGKTFEARFGGTPGAAGAERFQTDYLMGAVSVPAGGKAETKGYVFAGAKEVNLVDSYATKYEIPKFDLLIDWGWFYFLTKPMFYALDFFFKLVGNFGLAILIVTFIIKLVLFPLANKSYVSMSKMKKLQPELMKLKDRYGDDRMRQQQAMMELYKKEKVNPASGCLPILVQIPVFFALYKVLFVTIEMRHAPFYGWIKDLSAPDPTSIFNLFGLLPFDPATVPVVGHFLMIGAWPLIMGVTMWVQMKLNPAPPDPVQAKVFAWMPVFFTFLLAGFPAGLVIYWAWNNLLSVIQQAAIMHRQGVEIPLLENLGFKTAGNGKTASETEPADSEAKPAKPAKKRAKSEAPAPNPDSGETQSEPKS